MKLADLIVCLFVLQFFQDLLYVDSIDQLVFQVFDIDDVTDIVVGFVVDDIDEFLVGVSVYRVMRKVLCVT